MKDITPSADLGERIVDLLSKPHAPVSREFIDRFINKKRDPRLQICLGDTLIWLHLMGRIQRDFHKPETHPNCTETVVWFWIADVDYDGYINAEPDFTKYNIVSIIEGEKPKPKPAPVVESEDELVDPDQLIGDAEPDPEPAYDLARDPDVPADMEKQIARIPPAEVTGKTKTMDVRIVEWAAQQERPWTAAECRNAINANPAIFGMRLSVLRTKGKIQEGKYRESRAYWFAENDAHPEFRANVRVGTWYNDAPKEKPVKFKKQKIERLPAVGPTPVVPETVAVEEVAPATVPASTTQVVPNLLRVDCDAPEFQFNSRGGFALITPDLTLELSPATMLALAAFGRRHNLFGAT